MHLDALKKHARFATAGAAACLAAAAVLLSSPNAEAHFQLLYPPPWITQDGLGDPQKAAPCGTDSQQPGAPTNDVTTFAPGQTITLHMVEQVAHDGWYRVSVSYANRADLSDPPYETSPAGCTSGPFCTSIDAGIESPVVAPVIYDGILKHAASVTIPKDWTYSITLPTKPCDKCTLQVEEIMLNHGVNQADGPFTYHHCADIAIVANADGGTTTKGADGGTVPVTLEAGIAGGGSSSGGAPGGSSSGSTGAGSSGGDSDASDGTGEASGGGSGVTSGGSGNGTSGSSGGSSGGCDASGRGTTAVAGFGLLVGAIAAGLRRRRRRATN
jgi:hypothetical protein